LTDSPGTPGAGEPERHAGADPLAGFDPAKIEPDLRAMTRIVLRPIGSPLPLGFFTVAIDNVLVSTLQWGVLPRADRRSVALIVLPAFVVQAVVGIFAIGARDSIAGTLMLSFATTWLVDALILYLNPPGAAAHRGSAMQASAPPSGRLPTVAAPPCVSAMAATRDSPSPQPGSRARLPRVKGWNARAAMSSAKPVP
jgi:hypothetical protein